MRSMARFLVKGVLSGGFLCVLGFGVAQAAPAPLSATAGACHPEACLNTCSSKGFASGYCSGGGCYCIGL
jgi:hypothetical protein